MGIERAALVFAFVALAALVVGGCSEPAEVKTSASPTPKAVSPPISKATWTGGVWPFTVPDGVLKCYVEDSMETFTSGGVEYGLNATAKRFGNFRDIDEHGSPLPLRERRDGGDKARLEGQVTGVVRGRHPGGRPQGRTVGPARSEWNSLMSRYGAPPTGGSFGTMIHMAM